MVSSWHLLLLSSLCLVCSGLSSNKTIDNTLGDPSTNSHITYSPSDEWVPSTSKCGAPPAQCPPNPNLMETFNATWHSNVFQSNDSTSALPRVEVKFTGTAVYVHCIILSSSSRQMYHTSMAFILDGMESGHFDVVTNGANDLAHNVIVYANSSLAMGQHNLTIINGRADGQRYLMTLDYIEYTTDVPGSFSFSILAAGTEPSKTKALIGALVAVCLVLGIILAYFLYRLYTTRIRRGRANSETDNDVLPTSTKQTTQSPVWGWRWVTRCLGFNVSKQGAAFNPSLFVAGRPRLRSESAKDLTDQRQIQTIFEDEVDKQSKKSITESRWAFITSWRDRAIMEAEIPSLPPTSHAPTTVISCPIPVPEPHALNSQRPRPLFQQPEPPGTKRTTRRGFTVMNI